MSGGWRCRVALLMLHCACPRLLLPDPRQGLPRAAQHVLPYLVPGSLTLPLPPSAAQPIDFRQKFPEADDLAIDLMLRMLMFDPRKRIGVEEALRHPWLAQLHDESQEPSAPGGPSAAALLLHAGSWPAASICCDLLRWSCALVQRHRMAREQCHDHACSR